MKAKEPVQEFFSIGDVCTLTDLKPHVLRYWERIQIGRASCRERVCELV